MNERNRKEFAEAMARLFAIYGDTVTPNLLSAWWGALASYSVEAVKLAMNRHASDPAAGMFRPTPAHIIKHLTGTPDSRALIAWSRVLQAIKGAGAPANVAFDDVLIHRTIIDMGGWLKLCQHKEAEIQFVAKDFTRIYANHAASSFVDTTDLTPWLQGATEKTYQRFGDESQVKALQEKLAGPKPAALDLASGQALRMVTLPERRLGHDRRH